MTPLVSIIIPTYNRAHIISETLDSVLAQTYTNWECIVVDDGSTDDTINVLKAYVEKDKRFQLHKRPTHKLKGANACRNFGFKKASGAYVNFFDSDDVMHEDKLKLQVQQLQSKPEHNFTVCQTLVFENTIENTLGLRKNKIYEKDFFNAFVANKIKWLTQAPLLKVSFLKEHNISFDESLQQSQERDFFLKVLAVTDHYLYNDIPLVYFRKHNSSISSGVQSKSKLYSNFKVSIATLQNYKLQLNEEAIQYTRKRIHKVMYTALLLRYLRLSIQMLFVVVVNTPAYSFKQKLQLCIGVFSMITFKKGEAVFK